MRIKTFIALCCLSIGLSYCNQKKELRGILAVDCYWDILDKGSIHPINSCYKFDKEGSCNFYYYNFFDKKKTDSVYLFDQGDVIVRNKWYLINDSLVIRSNKYYVIKYDPDSVFLTATGADTMVLIKNCRTYNPKDK